MGAVVLSDIDRRRPSRLHGHIGRVSGYRPLPVLCLRRDLPGPADPRPYNLQGVRREARLIPSLGGAQATKQSSLPLRRWIASPALAMTSSQLLDLDLVGIERQVAGDFRHRRKWLLIGPDRVFECLAVGVDAEIIRIPLVRAVRHPVGAR